MRCGAQIFAFAWLLPFRKKEDDPCGTYLLLGLGPLAISTLIGWPSNSLPSRLSTASRASCLFSNGKGVGNPEIVSFGKFRDTPFGRVSATRPFDVAEAWRVPGDPDVPERTVVAELVLDLLLVRGSVGDQVSDVDLLLKVAAAVDAGHGGDDKSGGLHVLFYLKGRKKVRGAYRSDRG